MVALASNVHAPQEAAERVRREVLARLHAGRIELPILPEAASAAIALLREPSSDPRHLLQLVRRDAALTAHVMRMAASPFYGRGIRIVSLAQAVARLGTVTLSEMVLATCAKSPRFAVAGFAAEVKLAFEHAFATAFFAQEIARAKRWNVEEAFLCGLLHNLGYPVALQAIIAAAERLSRSDTLAVAEQLHAEIGAALVASWALPASVVDAARYHHAPHEAGPHMQQAAMAQLGDALADLLLDRPAAWDGDLAAHPAALCLHLYPEELASVRAKQVTILDTLRAMP